MKKYTWIIPLMAVLLISVVYAGTTIGDKINDKEISSKEYDAIKTYISEKNNIPEKDIMLEVEISDCIMFKENYCKFNAVLKNVIQSYDIILRTNYCSEINEETGECITYSDYTDQEINQQQNEYVASRVETFGSKLISNDEFTTSIKPTGGKTNLIKSMEVKK